ncbi:MAG: glycosyltransferase family 4 protein [Candidatus Jordarchaeaceae archaeon]
MRIGHFVSLFPTQRENVEVYGAGRVAYHLCKHLSKKGHSIHVFVPFKKSFVEKENNLSIHFYGSQLKIGIMNISYKLFFDPLNYPLDIVHIHNDTPISVVAGLKYAMKMGKPLVVTWHGDWMPNYGHILRRIGVYLSNGCIVKKILSKADLIITPSIHYAKESRFLGNYANKIVEIPNGIDLQDFDIPFTKEDCRKMLGLNNAENVILFLGALYQLKGPQVLLKAIPKVIEKHRGTIFVFAGDGNVEKYKELAEEIKVQKYVRFTGYVEKLKPLYYKAADIFVLPSTEIECFPIVSLEAMACGVPIIASRVGGIPDIVKSGENGLLVPPKDSDILAEVIIYLLENEAVRKKMEDNGRKKVKNYTWDRIIEITERIYEQIIINK